MLDSPPPYTPLPSIWTRIFNWVWPPSSVAYAVGDLQLGVAVPVEDLRPKPKYAQITFAAVYDIRFCEKLFDQWMTELNNRSKKPDERERRLKSYLGFLKEDAGWCSNAINKIVQLHVRFASLMAQRIDNASKSQCNLEYDDSETTTIANDISEASDSLSTYVTQIKDNLKLFVSVLEEVQVTMKKEPSWVERIPGWLKSLYKTIASIVATVCSPISALLPSAEPKRKIPLSALGEWAAIFRTADSEPQEGKVSESLESLILFLRKIVPREVQDAQEKLERFDEALDIMGLERHMRAGQRVILYGPDLAAVAEEWRDQAKQYQWMLPDNEDPAF